MILHPGKIHKIEVSFELERSVDLAYIKDFVIDALESWGGQKHPDDELFGSLEKVRVKRIPTTKK